MKKIYNFKQFVNESYNIDEGVLSNLGSKISQWAKQLMTAVKNGIIKLISSGPKKGLPAYMLFTSDEGSIYSQVEKFYKGTPYYDMNNINNLSTANEAVVPMEWDRDDDVPNSTPSEIEADIKRSLKACLEIADKIDASTDEAEKEKLQRELRKIKPYFIYGAPGIGKTQIVAKICDDLGLELLNCDGLSAEPVDFAGVPKVVDIEAPSAENPLGKGVTRSNVNADILPYDNGKKGKGGILFIDEFNRMPVEVQKIFLLLAQQRRLGINYQMPTRWYIVAAGNRKVDDPKGGIVEMGSALQDRFEIVNLVTNPGSLRKYVENTPGLSEIFLPELLDFLDFDASWFHMNDPTAKKLKYPTPRAWEDASRAVRRVIQEYEQKGITELPHNVLAREFQKNVGRDAAIMFLDFYKLAKHIPVKELGLPFTDPDKAPIPSEFTGPTKRSGTNNITDYEHALITAVIRKSKELNITSVEACNFTKWLKRTKCSPEVGSMAISGFVRNNKHLSKSYEATECLDELARMWGAEIGVEFGS
jgi:hypothetical protein